MLPLGSWFAKLSLGLYLATGTNKSTPCHFVSYILSFGVKLINELPIHYFFSRAFLPGSFPFEIDPFPSLYFFLRNLFPSSWLAPRMQFLAYVRYISDSLWFFFPRSLRLRYRKQMQQITPSPLLRLSSFPNSYYELFTMSHIHCAQILYSLPLYPWFSAFHTLWLTEWTREHLCFPGCRNLDEVIQPISGQAWANVCLAPSTATLASRKGSGLWSRGSCGTLWAGSTPRQLCVCAITLDGAAEP